MSLIFDILKSSVIKERLHFLHFTHFGCEMQICTLHGSHGSLWSQACYKNLENLMKPKYTMKKNKID